MQTQSNPFSTRFTKPGAGEYLFADGSLPQVMHDLREYGYWGQIVGPHGSGKTTLLHAIRRELEAAGVNVVMYELHDGQRRLPVSAGETEAWTRETIVIVDGYEQLSWWSRRRLMGRCRSNSAGLLITTHEAQRGIPLLHQSKPSLAIAQEIVARLAEPSVISSDVVQSQFERTGGNIREMLFRLYDLFEERA